MIERGWLVSQVLCGVFLLGEVYYWVEKGMYSLDLLGKNHDLLEMLCVVLSGFGNGLVAGR